MTVTKKKLVKTLKALLDRGTYMDDGDFCLLAEVENKDIPEVDAAFNLLQEYAEETANQSKYLSKLPLIDALWWFIENSDDESPHKTTYYFLLRERMRTENK